VPDDAAPFLFGAGQVTGDIYQIDDRDIEGIAERIKREALSQASISRQPALDIGWLAIIPPTIRSGGRTGDNIGGEQREEFRNNLFVSSLIEYPLDNFLHVIGPVGRIGE